MQLELLTRDAKIKPMIVQNRCFANQGWDKPVREFCQAHKIMYQGFSLLTANRDVVQSQHIQSLAKSLGKTPEQIIFRFAMQIGIVPLTGTSNIEHMRLDLQTTDFTLSDTDIATIEQRNG
jgi:diketogulonate reductase-like aldo/keto reductase